MVQHTQIYQCNPSYKKTEGKNNHKIISLDADKVSDKITHPFMINVLARLGIQGSLLNIIKSNIQQADS